MIKPDTTLLNPIPKAISLNASATATEANPTANKRIYDTTSVKQFIPFKAKSPNPGPIAFNGFLLGFVKNKLILSHLQKATWRNPA